MGRSGIPWLASLGAAGAIAVAVLYTLSSPREEQRTPVETQEAATLGRRLADLEERLRRLEDRPLAAPERSPLAPSPPVAEGTRDPRGAELEALRVRVDALEKSVAGLREMWLRGGAARLFADLLPPGASAAEIKQVLKALGYPYPGESNPPRDARIALNERLLREFPEDPDSAKHLRDLFQDLVGGSNTERARAALDEFGRRAGIPELDLDTMRAGSWMTQGAYETGARVAEAYETAARAYERIAQQADAPQWSRAEARFWSAYATMKAGHPEEAFALFEELIRIYGSEPPPEIRNTIAGAQAQVESLRKQLGR